ncbi:MAG: type II toxin-antitoxin system PemK/MazF family toxin [Candidatus Paceibacterota bacterium]|jgi:mRNA interferase MazF
MYKGTIVLIPFPFTDLSSQKIRPALVLHNQANGEDCIVSFISSNSSKKVGQYEICVIPTKNNGLKVNSVIKVNKIATLQKKTIIGELGKLESMLIKELDVKLKNLFKI